MKYYKLLAKLKKVLNLVSKWYRRQNLYYYRSYRAIKYIDKLNLDKDALNNAHFYKVKLYLNGHKHEVEK
jgi:hypothetical protein